MPKHAAGTVLELEIKFSNDEPLHRQLYNAVKLAILQGRLRPGTRLPSTRLIAGDLRISRTTVLNAFDQLSAEGYLQGKVGSGTRVASYVPGDLAKLLQRSQHHPLASMGKISRRGHIPAYADLSFLPPSARPLRPGQPEVKLFPVELWSRLAAKHWRRANRVPEHIDSFGYRPLRQAICDYVGRLRGVRCEPDHVLIVCGAQQALYLCAKTLLDPGESVWMEDPGYPRARAAFKSAQLSVVPLPVDSEGLNSAVGPKKRPRPQMIYVTPSFQCPLGYTMTLGRRFDLLRVAARNNAWILEDDYFSEFRYGTSPVASLQSLDRNERVIYIGNFSKNIVPFLRIGFLIAPQSIVHLLRLARTSVSRQPPGIDQAALAEFIAEGHLERHIRSTLQVYRERRQALVDAIRQYGEGVLEVSDEG